MSSAARAEDREALAPRASRPRPAGRPARPRPRRRRRPSVPVANVPRTMSRVDRRADLERAVAVAPGAVDVVAGGAPPSSALARRHGRLEAGVQLLVVGAQRGVGDLDARLGVGRHVQDPSSRGRARGAVGDVAVSLARRRPRPATRRWRRAAGRRAPSRRASTSAGPCLPDEDEDAAQADPLRGPDVGPDVVADHRDVVRRSAGRRRRDLAAQRRRPPRGRTSGDGLPTIRAATPGRELEPDDERAGVERRALGRQPPRVAMHADRAPRRRGRAGTRGSGCRYVSVLGRVADDDRRDAVASRRRASSWRQQVLAVELASARRRSARTNSGSPGKCARGVGGRRRQRGLEPLGRDRRARSARTSARASRG